MGTQGEREGEICAAARRAARARARWSNGAQGGRQSADKGEMAAAGTQGGLKGRPYYGRGI